MSRTGNAVDAPPHFAEATPFPYQAPLFLEDAG
jgi:hypothetical protein